MSLLTAIFKSSKRIKIHKTQIHIEHTLSRKLQISGVFT